MRKAAIDVGSNSVLAVVGELGASGVDWVWEASSVTGLGEGTKASGLLSDAGISRTLVALRSFFDQASALGAAEVVAKATMAARIARNTDEFLSRAAEQKTHVTILSGDDEAELGFRAVAEDPLFETERRISIIDPGGNSTELVTADRVDSGWHTRFRQSFPIGTLGLRDGALQEESPDSASVFKAMVEIDDLLDFKPIQEGPGRVAVLGATGTNLITIRKGIEQWDPTLVHGETLDYEEVGRAVGWLCRLSDAERARIRGIEPGREKTIHIGTLILERFMHAIRAEQVVVSVRGWRHALLVDLFRSEA